MVTFPNYIPGKKEPKKESCLEDIKPMTLPKHIRENTISPLKRDRKFGVIGAWLTRLIDKVVVISS